MPFELGKQQEYIGNPLVVAQEHNDEADFYLSHGTAMEIHGMVMQPRLVFHITALKESGDSQGPLQPIRPTLI
ncbi:MAG: hypothetical protein M0P04_09970 [Syntrophales bacterium]|nr:hypothetical protein [Syntrophales bacterium]MDD4340166.1 hypothetical protein [Syntrophales bacterium]HPB70678.1 hypothetical protein [Syntrophales bacterium]HQN26290.1 hypothetical protein [Syntrophales bacterium]HQP28606.1 hypothetical protein [Syntrophales bacterium]